MASESYREMGWKSYEWRWWRSSWIKRLDAFKLQTWLLSIFSKYTFPVRNRFLLASPIPYSLPAALSTSHGRECETTVNARQLQDGREYLEGLRLTKNL